MRLVSRAGLALTCAIIVAACGGSIDDPKIQQVQSPLVGQWALTTKMDTLTGETSYLPPTCTQTYCRTYSTQVGDAELGGVLQVRDSLGLKGIVATSVQASGTLTQTFVGNRRTPSYIGDITGTPDSTTAKSLAFTLYVPDSVSSLLLTIRSSNATYAGDSIYGRFAWGYTPGRYPQTYYGSFVMRRVK
jgi:hypothetical protein